MQQFSIWEQETLLASKDVIIVGGGFAGLWSALHLKQSRPEANVLILESGVIPTGASTKNAGFCCFGSPSELLHDLEQMGEKEMWKLIQLRYEGLQLIKETFPAADIDYENAGGYECFKHQSAVWERCMQQLDWLNAGLKGITGYQEVFTPADHRLEEFGLKGFQHLLGNRLEGVLHPAKLLAALVSKVQSLGVQMLNGITVDQIEEHSHGLTLITHQGLHFGARQVLLCTNAFTAGLVPGVDIVPNRGQVIITNPIENLRLKGAFHFDEGFYYFRNVGNRLLIGGARNIDFETENTVEFTTTPLILETLTEFVKSHILPGETFEITHSWSGIMGMGRSKFPIAKPLTDHLFCCAGFSGMGVALAPVITRELVCLMQEHS